MKKIVPKNLIKLANSCPFPLYIVGGRVRDYLAGLPDCSDTDICAPAAADDFIACAESSGYTVEAVFKNTGTVKIACGGENVEFASFRSDEYVRGEHRPVRSFFTDDIMLDARRRDFKCNAVYYDIKADKFVDPLGGITDIEERRLTTVAPAEKVFSEDGLRLMRLARIAAQTGFTPADDCLRGAMENHALISDVHSARIYAELNMILHADERYGMPLAQYKGLKILKDTGVLGEILPELCEGDGMKQRSDYHKYDVLEHSLRTVAYADKSVRLAALLHDVGKPYCKNNNGSFIGHEEEGARISADICERLNVPKKLTEETVRLISVHMYDVRGDAKENKVRKFILANHDILDKIFALKQADFSACRDDVAVAPFVVKFGGIYEKMKAEGVPFSLKDLNVKGDGLINIGFPPEEVGKTLESLLADCAINLVPNENDKLITRAVKVYLAPLKKR